MGAETSPSLSQELASHAVWVRRLARRLVRDEAAAEDVAQEVALAALRSPPAAGMLRSWLARVTGNLARRDWRTAAARSGGERAAARPESVPGADESATRIELVRLVAEELALLDEPLRAALVRRFFDGLSAAEIARQTGEPAPTVRWRIQRGLSELRARLDRRHGGDGVQWRLALLPLVRGAPGGASTAAGAGPMLVGAVQGVLAMQLSTQVVAAGALVLAVGIGVLLWRSKDGEPRAREALATTPSAPITLVAPVTPEDARAVDATPVPTREPAVEPRAERPEPTPDRATSASVDGRCIDERFLPVPGARVVEVGAAGSEAVSTSDGTFTLSCSAREKASRAFRVEARGLGTRFVEARVAAGTITHLGDIALVPGGSVVGRVVDERGAPFPEALVTVTGTDLWTGFEAARRSGPPSERVLTASSAFDGTFRLEDVPSGMVRVWASAPGLLHALSGAIEVPVHGATEELVLVLETKKRNDRIAGVVLDPGGETVPGAQVMYIRNAKLGQESGSFPADEHGRFELGAASDSTYDLYVGDPKERWLQIEVAGVEPGTEDLELRFVEWHEIEVTVKSAGKPVEEFALYSLEVEAGGLASGSTFCKTHGGGRETLLSARRSFRVHVDAPGFARAEQGPFEPGAPPRALAFDLVAEAGLRGRVTVYGEPVAGAQVTLHSWAVGERIEHGGYPALQAPYELGRSTTDAEGRFVLSPRSAGTFVVRAVAPELAAADSGPLEFDPVLGRDGIELALTQGGALEGRVLVAPARDPSGVIVALNRGDARPRTVRSDAEGRFRFQRLMPGRWHLARGKVEFVAEEAGTGHSGGTPPVIPFNCVVADGETTRQDLDLRAWEPCAIRGELALNGQPASGWLLRVWPGEAQAVTNELPSTATDSRGAFALEVEDAGPARFSFSPPAELGGQGAIQARVQLVPGPNPWRGDFATGSVEGTLGVESREWLLFYVTDGDVEPRAHLPLTPDASGRFRLPFVPAGRGSIRRLDRSDDRVAWSTLVELEVQARGTRAVELP